MKKKKGFSSVYNERNQEENAKSFELQKIPSSLDLRWWWYLAMMYLISDALDSTKNDVS